MTESKGAALPERKKWDKSEWEAKAKEKDKMYADRAKEAEAAMKEGRKPRFQDQDDKPRPKREMEDRNALDLNKNVGKTQIVQTSTSGKGPKGPGFYCEVCNRTLKDSISYLDHLNSGYHLRQLGQTTRTTRSTLGQVRARIAQLREETKHKTTAANFDFKSRLAKVKEAERTEKEARREDRKRKREERRRAEAGEQAETMDVEMEQMMGFGGFGGGKRR